MAYEYNIIGIPNEEVEQEIQKAYGDSPNVDYAHQVGMIAGEFIATQPVGWNVNSKKRQFRRSCRRYMSAKAKEKIKPVGFIESFIFWAILSGIISFFTQMIMRRIFNDNSNEGNDSDGESSTEN